MSHSESCHDTHSTEASSPGSPTGPGVADVLVENHRRFLDFLERRVARPQDAEEILQEAYVRSLARGDSIRSEEATTAWFYRLLRNALVDHYRRRGAERRALDAAGYELAGADREGTTPALDEELMNVVCGCVSSLLTTLKPSYAEALRRVDLEGRRVADYADEAGITPNNAAVRVHRAREALRTKLMKSCGTCAVHGCVDCRCHGGSASCA